MKWFFNLRLLFDNHEGYYIYQLQKEESLNMKTFRNNIFENLNYGKGNIRRDEVAFRKFVEEFFSFNVFEAIV